MIKSYNWKLRSNPIVFNETRDSEDHKYSNTNHLYAWNNTICGESGMQQILFLCKKIVNFRYENPANSTKSLCQL
jgi:hypothetical protein